MSADELRARGGGKWRRYPPDVLPAYVADLDFKVAPPVQAALRRFTDLQDYGYGQQTDTEALFRAFAGWMQDRHSWSPDPALTIALDDVVQGIVATVVAYSAPGDGVIVQTPAYPPFLRAIEWTGRQLVENPLFDDGGRFVVDVEGLRHVAAEGRVLLLCNPHNPSGRVLERGELEAIAQVAGEHEITIVADEIHADLIYAGARHVPMETILAEQTVTLTSATKSFNIPAFRTAVLHFGSDALYARLLDVLPQHLLGQPSRPGVDATIAAWTEGRAWLDELLAYLHANREIVTAWASTQPAIGYHPPESTYLAWFDCRHLQLVDPFQFFLDSAKVGLSNGPDFGNPGEGHVRLNFGTSAEILQEILDRMSTSLEKRPRRESNPRP
ncbi:MAG TPA: PatB family C-S lyase [Candidatus Dormibacteraeota bacterium]|nr:PatB family C-S lyase [Candidatus Dormibacteraeota bacterium]